MAEPPVPHYFGHRKRLRERLVNDPRGLPDYEILELILAQTVERRDTKPLAKFLLERFGSLKEVLYAPMEQLRAVHGFGPALEAAWVLHREFFARIKEAPARERQVFSSPDVVAEGAKARFGSSAKEEFWVALVDNRNRLITWERVSQGTVNQTAVFPREVLSLALKHHAAGLILVHNHPGGDASPSQEDEILTARIARAATDLGLRVLDHLVVTDDSHFSFQERGLL